MQNTAEYLYQSESIPDKNILKLIKQCNAKETLSSSGWPRTFSPTIEKCPKCNILLSPVTKKKRRSRDDHSVLISMDHIIEVDIFTKQCKICFLIMKPDTLNLGLLNIGDMTLVTVDIFFSLQNTIRFANAKYKVVDIGVIFVNPGEVFHHKQLLPLLSQIFWTGLITSVQLTGNITSLASTYISTNI